MAQTFVHTGPCETIPHSASQGLVFLKFILPALDALGPFHGTPDLAHFLSPEATFTMNNGEPVDASSVLGTLKRRGRSLSRFTHRLHAAWDIAKRDGSRTVMYESTSVTVFMADRDGVEVKMKEFNVIELVPSEAGCGVNGLQAVKFMAYLDGTPVTERAEVMMRRQSLRGM